VAMIRVACDADASALAELAESTFRAAFSAMNSAGHMDLHCRTRYGERIQAAEIADPAMTTLLAEHAGALIGYVQLRWGSAPACVTSTRAGEVQRLYVAGQWHGTGVAQALMDAAIGEVRDRGLDAAWLGVWEHNPRAIAFYTRLGFVEVGSHTFDLGGDAQRDIVMMKTLAAAANVESSHAVDGTG